MTDTLLERPDGAVASLDAVPPAGTRPRVARTAVHVYQEDRRHRWEQVGVYAFVIVPFLALAFGVYYAWGHGISWTDVAIATFFFFFTGHGITVGFHRYFTHKSFKAKQWVRVLLAVAGSMAIEGPVIRWVADHRKHHKFSDKEGDPHSPWRYGRSFRGLCKGFFWAHMGWLFDKELTPQDVYAPDLEADPTIRRISRTFPAFVVLSLALPPLLGGLITMSWRGMLTAFVWGSLVRVLALHHVTWSINSVCHMVGDRPFESRDEARNFWPLAILSFGESWHNLHHADPTCARHGALRGQIDSSARIIWIAERFGWVRDVRWPEAQRLERKRRVLA